MSIAVNSLHLLQGRVASADVSGLLQQDRGINLGEAPANIDSESLLHIEEGCTCPAVSEPSFPCGHEPLSTCSQH